MRLSDTQFEILKLCYKNKDIDILFSNNDFKKHIPKFDYRDTVFLHEKDCLEKLGDMYHPQYIISNSGMEVYLDNKDRRSNEKTQKRSYIIAIVSLIAGILSTVASIVAAFFAYYFR